MFLGTVPTTAIVTHFMWKAETPPSYFLLALIYCGVNTVHQDVVTPIMDIATVSYLNSSLQYGVQTPTVCPGTQANTGSHLVSFISLYS